MHLSTVHLSIVHLSTMHLSKVHLITVHLSTVHLSTTAVSHLMMPVKIFFKHLQFLYFCTQHAGIGEHCEE